MISRLSPISIQDRVIEILEGSDVRIAKVHRFEEDGCVALEFSKTKIADIYYNGEIILFTYGQKTEPTEYIEINYYDPNLVQSIIDFLEGN